MRSRRTLSTAAVLVVAGTLALVAGCASAPTACAAVAYSGRLSVEVTGDVAAVADVGFCAGRSCTPVASHAPGASAFPATAPPTPTPTTGAVWMLYTEPTSAPPHGHVAAFDRTGATLVDDAVDLSWTHRVTNGCPGPSSARTTLRVP